MEYSLALMYLPVSADRLQLMGRDEGMGGEGGGEGRGERGRGEGRGERGCIYLYSS